MSVLFSWAPFLSNMLGLLPIFIFFKLLLKKKTNQLAEVAIEQLQAFFVEIQKGKHFEKPEPKKGQTSA